MEKKKKTRLLDLRRKIDQKEPFLCRKRIIESTSFSNILDINITVILMTFVVYFALYCKVL